MSVWDFINPISVVKGSVNRIANPIKGNNPLLPGFSGIAAFKNWKDNRDTASRSQSQQAAANIEKFTGDVNRNVPGYVDYSKNVAQLQNVDPAIMNQYRDLAYAQPGQDSTWSRMAKQNIDAQRDQGLQGLQQSVGSQTQGTWNRMASRGLTGGAAERTGYKGQLAGAIGAQGLVGQAQQQAADTSTQNELDRQLMLAKSPDMENAAGEMGRTQADLNLAAGEAKSTYGTKIADIKSEQEAARVAALSKLDQGDLRDAGYNTDGSYTRSQPLMQTIRPPQPKQLPGYTPRREPIYKMPRQPGDQL